MKTSVIWVVVLLGLFAVACGGSNDGSTNQCEEGSTGCACYGNQTCDDGLSCVGGTCVDPDAPADAGDGDGGDAGRPSTPGHTIDEVDCANLVPLRGWKTEPSAVGLLFTVQDCGDGLPVHQLGPEHFVVEEDGEEVSSEAFRDILSSRGFRVFVTLLLDMSDSTQPNLAQVVAGAQDFVHHILVERGLAGRVYIGVRLFDGSDDVVDFQRPISEPARLRQKLGELAGYQATDGAATNLNGALLQGVRDLQSYQQNVISHNQQGVVTTGYVLLFTDGGDTAGRQQASAATAAVQAARTADINASPEATVQTYAVALRGDDYDRPALEALVGGAGAIAEAADADALQQTFNEMATQIAAQVDGTYLLAYCSSKRAGAHTVTLELDPQLVTGGQGISFDFSADGFGPGCNEQFFQSACDDKECGGFNCGMCEPSSEVCDAATSSCENYCLAQNQCDGETLTHPLGFEQSCDFGAEVSQCGGQCIDTLSDAQNCGGCGVVCQPEGSSCVDAECRCADGELACGTECVDETTDSNNCGACGNACPSGVACADGVCDCGGGEIACFGVCTDTSTDAANCGGCGNSCGVGSVCVDGGCECPAGQTFCASVGCVNTTIDPNHCGQCGRACDLGCQSGACIDALLGKKFGGSARQWGTDIAVDRSGNIYFVGTFESSIDLGGATLVAQADRDVFLAKFDATGSHLWSKRFGSAGSNGASALATDAAGNVVFAYTSLDAQDNVALHTRKQTAAGGDLWYETFALADPGTSVDVGSVAVDGSGNVVMTGWFGGSIDFGGGALMSTDTQQDSFLVKLDASGNHLWSKRYGSDGQDIAREVELDAGGNIVVTGYYSNQIDFGGGALTNENNRAVFVAKLDASGAHLWSKAFKQAPGEYGYGNPLGLALTPAGEVVVTGAFTRGLDFGGGLITTTGANSYADIFLVKLDAAGNHLWSKGLGGNAYDSGRSVGVDSDGNIILVGTFEETMTLGTNVMTSAGGNDIFVAGFDGSGHPQWSFYTGDSADQAGPKVVIAPQGGFALGGTLRGTVSFGSQTLSANEFDAYLVKMGAP